MASTLQFDQWQSASGVNRQTILQVAQAIKYDTWTGTATFGSYTPITGLSVSITPVASTSRFLIMTTINYDNNRGNSGGGFVIFRNGSLLSTSQPTGVQSAQYAVFADFGANANADQSGMSRSMQVVDSPSTLSTLTYDIRITQDSTSYTTYVNRARTDANQNDDCRMISSMVIMEIAG